MQEHSMASDTAATTAPEEGKQVEEAEVTSSEVTVTKPVPAVPESHPLEHAWTLWFDNPSPR